MKFKIFILRRIIVSSFIVRDFFKIFYLLNEFVYVIESFLCLGEIFLKVFMCFDFWNIKFFRVCFLKVVF